MKLPSDYLVQQVANYYGFKTKGKLVEWLKMINPNAAVHYYSKKAGDFRHTRVSTLLQLLGCNEH
jgi:hypothetical protein